EYVPLPLERLYFRSRHRTAAAGNRHIPIELEDAVEQAWHLDGTAAVASKADARSRIRDRNGVGHHHKSLVRQVDDRVSAGMAGAIEMSFDDCPAKSKCVVLCECDSRRAGNILRSLIGGH